MIRKTFALGAALLVLAGAALAQTATRPTAQPAQARPDPGARMFEMLDANRDGRVTWDETWTFATTRFNAADADRSGGLAQGEFANLRPRREGATGPRPEWAQRMEQRRAAMFRALDANSDGQVTLAEMQAPAQARFRAMDANSDGAVSRDELPQRMHLGHHHHHQQGPEAAPAR